VVDNKSLQWLKSEVESSERQELGVDILVVEEVEEVLELEEEVVVGKTSWKYC
jgi:hypothetical protein